MKPDTFTAWNGAVRGQAMVEFIVAIFAVVMIIAGITEFIGLAGKRGDIFAEVRGKAGKASITSSVTDVETPRPPEMPAVETSEAVLSRGFAHEKDEEKVALSPAMRNWVFDGKLEELTVRGEVWMPGLKIGGVDE